MTELEKHSLWLIPSGEAELQAKGMVEFLAKHSDSPEFLPHVTLVRSAEAAYETHDDMIDGVRTFASSLVAFDVSLPTPGMQDVLFRSLYLHNPNKGANPELVRVYEHAMNFFPAAKDEWFMDLPHMSIAYTEAGHIEKLTTFGLMREAGLVDPEGFSFHVGNLALVNTGDEDPTKWQVVSQFPLATDTD